MASDSRSFNYSVNGFRGVCVVLVFFYHVVNSGLIAKPPYESPLAELLFFIGSAGRYGVELFFMISGFVIVDSLRRHASVHDFLWDRFARIFPVWAPIHIALFAVGLVAGIRSFSALSGMDLVTVFVANLLLIPPLVQLPQTHDGSWSLTYEWLFYLLAAATVALASVRSKLARYAGQGLIAGLAVASLCLLPRGLFFIPGILLGMGWLPLQRLAPLLKYPFMAVFIFLLAWRGVDLNAAHPAAYSLADVFTGWPLLLTTISLLAATYAFAGICVDGKQTAWLRHGLMQQLGKISYSFYLWHPVVMFATKRITYAWVLPWAGTTLAVVFFAATSFALAFAISTASQSVLEARVGKALRQWLKPKRITSSVPAAATLTTPQAGGT